MKQTIVWASGVSTTIRKHIDTYMRRYLQLPYNRDCSYDFCHDVFIKNRRSTNIPETADYLALNLYTFLASWGMVTRGNLLMNSNYKLLIDAVKVVCDVKYDWLVDVDIFAPGFNKTIFVECVIELKENLKAILGKGANNTLLSKILLVTLGCVPAYDTYVIKSLNDFGCVASFGKAGLKDILDFADVYKAEIINAMEIYRGKTIVPYSPMKYIDMALCEK